MTTATDLHLPRSQSDTKTTLDITVLMGGPGAEREVSLNSGSAVAVALRRLGHNVTCCDVSPQDLSALDKPADLVFIALHGTFGEDGELQAILSERSIPYVGSDQRSSHLTMDKAQSKERFVECDMENPLAPKKAHRHEAVEARQGRRNKTGKPKGAGLLAQEIDRAAPLRGESFGNFPFV